MQGTTYSVLRNVCGCPATGDCKLLVMGVQGYFIPKGGERW